MAYRVQMVSDGIPAYQADFDDKQDAIKAAYAIAHKMDFANPTGTELIRFENKKTVVRAFKL